MRNYLFSVLIGVFLLTSISIASAQVSPEGTFVVNDNLNQCAILTDLSEDPPEGWRHFKGDLAMLENKSLACQRIGYDYIGSLNVKEPKAVQDIGKDYEQVAGYTPDSPLYLLDKGLEKVKLAIFKGEEKKNLHLKNARERLAEAKVMAEKGMDDLAVRAFSDHKIQANKAGAKPSSMTGKGFVSVAQGNQKPVANLTVTKVGWNKFKFNATASYDLDGSVERYEYALGPFMLFDRPQNMTSYDYFLLNTSDPVVNYTFSNVSPDVATQDIYLRVFDDDSTGSESLSKEDIWILKPKSDEIIWRQNITRFDHPGFPPRHLRLATELNDTRLFASPLRKNEIYALDKSDGNILWNETVGPPPGGRPVVEDGTLYQLKRSNVRTGTDLFAFDLNNRNLSWVAPLSHGNIFVTHSDKPAINGSYVYVSFSYSFDVYKINKTSGNITVYGHVLGPSPWSKFTFKDGKIIGGARDGATILNKTDLSSIMWWRNLGWSKRWVGAHARVWKDNIIILTGGKIYAFPLEDSPMYDNLWEYDIPEVDLFDPLGPPTLVGNKLYFGTESGLYAFDLSDQTMLWNYSTPSTVWTKPVATENGLYFKSAIFGRSAKNYIWWSSEIVGLDRKTGNEAWKKDLGGSSGWTKLIIEGDRIYTSSAPGLSKPGFIYAFNRSMIERGTEGISTGMTGGTGGPYPDEEVDVTEDQQQNATSPYEEEEANVTEDTQQNTTGPYD